MSCELLPVTRKVSDKSSAETFQNLTKAFGYLASSSKFQDTDILGQREPSLSDESVASQEVLLRMGFLDFDWSSMKSSKAVQLSNRK